MKKTKNNFIIQNTFTLRRFFTYCLIVFAINAHAQKFKEIRDIKTPNEKNKDLKILNPLSSLSHTISQEKSVIKTFKNGLSKGASEFKVLARDKAGLPIAIEGKQKNADDNRGMAIEVKAKSYLKSISPLLNKLDVSNEFIISNISEDVYGHQHIRMNQFWNDIQVYGSEIILHTDGSDVHFMNGRYAKSPADALPLTATVESKQSSQICRNDLGATNKESFTIGNLTVETDKSTLVYYKDETDQFHLCYHHTIYKNMIERWEYFVDALEGNIIKKYPSICKFHNHKPGHTCHFQNEEHATEAMDEMASTATFMDGSATANAQDLFGTSRLINTFQVGNKYYLIDGSRPMFNANGSTMPNDPVGTIWTIDAGNTSPQNDNFSYDHVTSTNNSWGNKTSVSAHYNGGLAYEYFKNLHARNSINGSGGNIISLINIADENGSSMGNAFWNGQAMFYGNGDSDFRELARGLDVAGHEMTHGVVQNTANLEYEGEAGALNESFADVFGVMIDRNDWLIGEDVVKTSAFPSGALRSMSDPHNGGSSLNSPGWQPKHYTERYTGSQDNGGVHINSGIPNHAFFLFASNAAVGKDKAEKVYYRALSEYLTKSSQFIDARIAVVKAANDLYGSTVASAAEQAFTAVGIGAGQGGNYEEDVEVNPGQEMILFTTDEKVGLYLFSTSGAAIANPLSNKNPASKPSVSDDGSLIVFVSDNNTIEYISINWNTGTKTEGTFNIPNSTWRSVALSKDGTKISALKASPDNIMWVFDLISGFGNSYELYNPTFSAGVNTGDVLYADVMDWDHSGEYVMYDANNRIDGVGGSIEFWDIGFIEVWNNSSNNFALDGKIEKLFPSLDEGITVGNPVFSKNSPYIIAFDYVEEGFFDASYAVLGANIESGDLGAIAENTGIGYPCFSSKDNFIIYNNDDDFSSATNLNFVALNNNKIQANADPDLYGENLYWGVWFSNGDRNLSALKDITEFNADIVIAPNPTSNKINVNLEYTNDDFIGYTIMNLDGKISETYYGDVDKKIDIDVSQYAKGLYFIKFITKEGKNYSSKFIKI